MLWTDGIFITAADLTTIDPEIVETAAADSAAITLSDVIERGTEEAARTLENNLVNFTSYLSSRDISTNHMNAVYFTGSAPSQRRKVSLDQIMISGRVPTIWSEIKTWAVNQVLMQFYMAASNRAEGDRYEKKWEYFTQRDKTKLWPALRKSGMPVVYRPMPRPAAAGMAKTGTWSVAMVSGAGSSTDDFDVAVSYLDGTRYISPSQDGNAESHPSVVRTITGEDMKVIQADITLLNPPDGTVLNNRLARGITLPLNASHWNVYVGATGSTLYLQNASPIPIATKTYALAGDPVLSGVEVGQGQIEDTLMTTQNLIQRG